KPHDPFRSVPQIMHKNRCLGEWKDCNRLLRVRGFLRRCDVQHCSDGSLLKVFLNSWGFPQGSYVFTLARFVDVLAVLNTSLVQPYKSMASLRCWLALALQWVGLLAMMHLFEAWG